MNFFKNFKENKLFFLSIEALILSCLVLILTKLDFLYNPIGTFISTLFAPIFIAGFLFYILNPVVTFIEKNFKFKRILAITIVFLILIAIFVLALFSLIPNLITQILSLAENVPHYIDATQLWLSKLTKSNIFKNIDLDHYIKEINISYESLITKTLNSTANSISSIFSAVTSTIVTIVTVPFILFYMLKDGKKLIPKISELLPEKRRKDFEYLLKKMNDTIATYISGQAIECCFVGTCMIIGYLFLGVEYAVLFGIIAGLTNIIPYLGPYLGLAPALLATVFDKPIKGMLCIVLVVVVQQIDGNIIYPNVIGKTLQIHPLTIIIVLLVAGNLAGLVGIILGVPIYAISKTILKFSSTIYVTRKEQKETNRQEKLLK